MLSLVLSIFFIVIISYKYLKNRQTLGLLFMYKLIPTYISVGTYRIDSWYFAIPIFLLIVIGKNGRKIRISNFEYIRHFKMLVILHSFYLFSWFLFNRHIDAYLVGTFMSVIKIAIIMGLCVLMNSHMTEFQLKKQTYTMLIILNSFNFLLCILQKLNTTGGLEIIRLLNDDGPYQFALRVVSFGGFQRCFGVFPYPMHMAIFCLFTIAYIGFVKEKYQHFRLLILCIAFVSGMLTASKTFYLGIIVLIFCHYIFNILYKGISLRKICFVIGLVIIFLLLNFNFEMVLNWIENIFGKTAANNMSVLTNFSKAFETRYTGEDATLSYMYDFLQTYWLMGAGPASLQGEAIMDSAFFVILHNGGVISLLIVLYYYFEYLLYFFKKHQELFVGLLCVMLVTGFGFQTWVASDSTMWVLVNLFFVRTWSQNNALIKNDLSTQKCGSTMKLTKTNNV